MVAKDVGIPGIAPEDVKVTPAQQAQINAYLASQKAEEEALGKEEPIELMESELMECSKIMQELQAKYFYRPAIFPNLVSLKNEADEKFGKIGLQVIVDWVLPGISLTPKPPEITIVGRLPGFEFNSERARYEVGKGVADKFYEAARAKHKKKLILPGG